MEKNIDWSKAPEGTTHYYTMGDTPWRDLSGKHWKWFSNGKWHSDNAVAIFIDTTSQGFIERRSELLIPNPNIIKAWNGEGLPPVGAHCETLDEDTDAWVPVKVFAHTEIRGNTHAVAQDESDMFFGLAHDYRPIKTPEQIAAEERKAAIKEIRDIIAEHDSIARFTVAAALYDAGFRKQVAK